MGRVRALHRVLSVRVLSVLTGVVAVAGVPAPQSTYRAQIERWSEQDALYPPPANAVVAVGSSSIRFWERLSLDFAPWDVIQRGFGGSTLPDVIEFVDPLVLAHDPAAVILFCGTNDVAAGRSASAVFADFETLVDTVRGAGCDAPILYIGITPTPARWSLWPVAAEVNARVAARAAADPSLEYVDTPSLFLATGQPPATALFLPDQLHLSQAGYDLWTAAVRPVLERVSPPSAPPFAPRGGNPLHPHTGARVLVDLGPADSLHGAPTGGPDAFGQHWNDWFALPGGTAILAGEHRGDLVEVTGTSTGFELVMTGECLTYGFQNGGLTSPNPAWLGNLAVASATGDYFFGDGELSPGGFLLRGLDPLRTYDLRLFASRSTTQTRITRYEITGHGTIARRLQTSGAGIGAGSSPDGNVDRVLRLEHLRPDPRGRLFVDLERVAGDWAYLALFELAVGPRRSAEPPGPARPIGGP